VIPEMILRGRKDRYWKRGKVKLRESERFAYSHTAKHYQGSSLGVLTPQKALIQ
jgi:hypothetical protein